MNDNKYGWTLLAIVILLIFCLVRFGPKSPEFDTQKKLKESEWKADSLQEIINKYEVIKHEIIKYYYDEKYKDLHNEVDTSDINSNVELLKQLLSE